MTLSPGVYCGLSIQGSGINVTLSPGLYVIKDGAFSLQGGPNITAAGVSFYLVGSAYFEFQGNPALSISAMTTGDFAGIAFASSPFGAAATSMIKGNGSTLLTAGSTGGIYLPNQKLVIEGNAELTLTGATSKVLIHSISLGGSAKLSVAADALAISMMTSSSRLE